MNLVEVHNIRPKNKTKQTKKPNSAKKPQQLSIFPNKKKKTNLQKERFLKR